MRRLFLIFLVALTLAGMMAAREQSVRPVAAAGFHVYSRSWENDASKLAFTGVNEVRDDLSISGIPMDGCTLPLTGTEVYQPEWVMFGADWTEWTELGTVHQCGDTKRWWYWGHYWNSGFSSSIHSQLTGPGPTHRFFIFNADATHCIWSANIDATQLGTFPQPCGGGAKVSAGLESYVSGAVVPANHAGDLKYSQNYQPYAYWDGDGSEIEGPWMCGFWVNAWTWSNAENTPCQ